MRKINEPYHLFDDPIWYYTSMLADIENASGYVYIQTYRIGNDTIGIKFRDLLVEKARQGVEIKVLIDSWGGGSLSDSFFKDLLKHGGEVRFFEKIKINFDFFTRSHRRNHRKLLIIDDKISYIGSSNLTDYNMNWRESVLRMQSDIAKSFKKVFEQDFKLYNRYLFDKVRLSQPMYHRKYEILRDVSSIAVQRIKNRYIELIKEAREQIVIETPYFLPAFQLRKALMDAAKRGVDVQIIIPRHSDVSLVDVLRNKYLGVLHKSNIRLFFYLPHNLHAKLLSIDHSVFSIGSTNFDYRSFRYMYEIVLIGSDQRIQKQLEVHYAKTLEYCQAFSYERWQNRPLISRFFEWLLLPFRHLL